MESRVPLINLAGLNGRSEQRAEIVQATKDALVNFGVMQVVNHGIPLEAMEEVMNEVKKFNERDDEEVRAKLYTADLGKKVRCSRQCNPDSKIPAWRNTLTFLLNPDPPTTEEFPSPSREKMLDYCGKVQRLSEALFKIVSEGLGLKANHLDKIGCLSGMRAACHYYPPSLEREHTIGTVEHCDASFLTVLLQDQVGGLQILHEKRWIEVPPVVGALVIFTGDFLQLITNDRMKSSVHRAVASRSQTRISIACLMNAGQSDVTFGPLQELIADNEQPLYTATSAREYTAHVYSMVDFTAGLAAFKLS